MATTAHNSLLIPYPNQHDNTSHHITSHHMSIRQVSFPSLALSHVSRLSVLFQRSSLSLSLPLSLCPSLFCKHRFMSCIVWATTAEKKKARTPHT